MKLIDDFVKRLKAQKGVALSVGAHSGMVQKFVNACLATTDASGHKHDESGKFTSSEASNRAHESSQKAHHASQEAMKSNESKHHRTASELHKLAWTHHGEAAEMQKKENLPMTAAMHEQMAADHQQHSKSHEEKSGKEESQGNHLENFAGLAKAILTPWSWGK